MNLPDLASIRVTLCADDYGIAPGVGAAIRELIGKGRLNATSCMTLFPGWPEQAALLKPLAGHAEFGLHLTLTDHAPLGRMPRLAPQGRLPPNGTLIRLALTGRLDKAELAAEIGRQIDAFTAAMGHPPAFVDGHQHVHQLPVIGKAVLRAVSEMLPAGAWVRYCDEPLAAIWQRGVSPAKAGLISLLGRGFARAGRRLGVPGNTSFRGVHDFSGQAGFSRLMERFLSPPQAGMLVMCHPGLVDPALAERDWVTAPREEEYRFLDGDEFPAALAAAGITLGG